MPAKKGESVSNIEKKVVENLVQLQKVESMLAEKLNNVANKLSGLTGQISKLLSLFEETAKSFSKQAPTIESTKEKEFVGKIDRLIEQNKTIAKGLTLMEEKVRSKSPSRQEFQSISPKF